MERLEDVREAAEHAIRFASGRTRSDLDDDKMLLLALVKCIEIIGEAASHLSDDAKARHAAVPWHKVVTMRHRLVHGYFDWNRDIVWLTVTESLPELLAALK